MASQVEGFISGADGASTFSELVDEVSVRAPEAVVGFVEPHPIASKQENSNVKN
jgi:hypothetical protein